MVREDFKSIEHETDIWHFAKCIKKKLTKIGKKHAAIKKWVKDIVIIPGSAARNAMETATYY